jgi:hypothetical protein
MFGKFKNYLLALSIFKQTNNNFDETHEAGMNTPSHLSSRKFSMTLIAVSIVAFMYFASITLLFFFNGDPHVSALVSMYKDMIVAIAAIAGTLVGIQGLVDWKYSSKSDSRLFEKKYSIQEEDDECLRSGKEEDYTTRIK